MKRIDGIVAEYQASTAEEFWEVLSPQKYIFGPRDEPIFRGQTKEAWHLEPSILRRTNHPIYAFPLLRSSLERSDDRIFAEIHALRTFAVYCDSTGLRIPGDSKEFREKYLDPSKMLDSFVLKKRITPSDKNSERHIWPEDKYFEIMALAQHFGLPTRLLDWSHSSYIAAYFAASCCLKEQLADGRLAVWALNTANIKSTLKNVRTIQVPGSNNVNVAAQRGLFTLLMQEYTRGGCFKEPHCLDKYVVSCKSHDLAKVTLPVQEAPKVIDLCERFGVTAATLFPGFAGAAKATQESLACLSKSEWSDSRDIRAQTLPACIRTSTE